jgi:5'-3' exoribonuclease 1
MGIPYYFYNIYKKYNRNFNLTIDESSIAELQCCHLFLDYNSMIHPCAQSSIKNARYSDEEIIEDCLTYTRKVISLVGALNVYIMIDGVAPNAKLVQQRGRRYKSTFTRSEAALWDSNKITPGTSFMMKLNNALTHFVEKMSLSYKIYVSDSQEPGEGEHKMMKIISGIKNERIVVYGLDADLIMLSLLNKNSENIILLRDTSFNQNNNQNNHNNNTNNNNNNSASRFEPYAFLKLSELNLAVISDIKQTSLETTNYDITKMVQHMPNCIHDYVFLCFLLGNDFLEHSPSLNIKDNALSKIIKSYTKAFMKYKCSLVQVPSTSADLKHSINIEMLKEIITDLAVEDDIYFKRVFNKKILRDTINNDKVEILQDDMIRFGESGYRERYYNYYNIHNLSKSCKDYLNGLYWVWGYYNGHVHSNWSWVYKSNASPFLKDLLSYITNVKELKLQIPSDEACAPLKQLMCVLPKDSLLPALRELDNDLSNKLERYLREYSLEASIAYPCKLLLDGFNKEYIWQTKVIFGENNDECINKFYLLLCNS